MPFFSKRSFRFIPSLPSARSRPTRSSLQTTLSQSCGVLGRTCLPFRSVRGAEPSALSRDLSALLRPLQKRARGSLGLDESGGGFRPKHARRFVVCPLGKRRQTEKDLISNLRPRQSGLQHRMKGWSALAGDLVVLVAA